MIGRFETVVGAFLARWVAWTARHALLVPLIAVASTTAVGAYTVANLGVNADLDDMFSPSVPFRAREIAYEQAFPLVGRDVIVVVDARTAEQAREAASALAERMRAEPALFKSVFEPEGPFFEDHALLYMDTEELEDFADRLARVQPYLAALARDGTLRGLSDLLGRGAAAVAEGDVASGELVPMLERFHRAVDAALAGDAYRLSWTEIVAGGEFGAGSRRRLVIMQPVLDFSDLLPGVESIEAVRRYARKLGFDESSGVRVRMTGDIALSIEEMTLVQGQATKAGLASMLLVGLLLMLSLRSLRLALATLFTLVLGLVWTAGFAAFAIGHLNMISVAFAVLFIGLSVDFALHFCMRYQELLSDRWPAAEALTGTARDVGASITLCAVTTAIGFFAFLPTEFAGVAELGLISGAGMFISLVMNLTVLPALISLHRPRRRRGLSALAIPAPRLIQAWSVRYPRRVAVGALVLGMASVVALPRLSFNADPISVRDPRSESVRTFEDLVAASERQPWEIAVIADDLTRGERLAARLRELDVVDEAFTVRDFVPENQEEKLEIIEDVALFLAPAPGPDGIARRPTAGEQFDALMRLRRELTSLARVTRDRELASTARSLAASLARFTDRVGSAVAGVGAGSIDVAMIEALEAALLELLPGQLDSLERAVNVGPVTLDELPAALVGRMVSAEGRVRVRVLPAEDLSDPEALERFVTVVRLTAPEATGSAVSIYEASRAAVRSFQQALGAATLVILVLLLLIWRTIGHAALVLAPLVLAAVLTGAVAVLAGIPINFADIIVLPLLLGIGVDSGIHLVERARLSQAAAGRLLETSTAHAVLFSSLTTIASFGTLGFAGHRGMASMGQLLAVGVALAVLSNLLVLPALIQLNRGQR